MRDEEETTHLEPDARPGSLELIAANLHRYWQLFRQNLGARSLKNLIAQVHHLQKSADQNEQPQAHAYATALLEACHHLSAGARPASEEVRNIEGLIRSLQQDSAHTNGVDSEMAELELVLESRRRRLVYLLGPEEEWCGDVRKLLEESGFQAESFSDYHALIQRGRDTLPLAVITELPVPGAPDGDPETIWEPFRQGQLKVPFVVVSDQADFNSRLSAIRQGGIRFFAKPVDRMALLAAIRQLCSEQPEEPFRILLVDDDTMLTEMYATVLDHEGYQVTRASHPREALGRLRECDPDLILLDLYLPTCSGIDLAHMIRQFPRFESTPIIFLSVETSLDVQLACARLSGEEFLTKPVAPWRLLMVVESRARRSRLLREENVRLAERVAYQAEHDDLTGLPNRLLFQDRLKQALLQARDPGRHVAVMMLDVDHFQRINDVYGHAAGDDLLMRLSRQLHQSLGDGDTLSRPGGDEFLILLPSLGSLETAALVASNLLDTASQLAPVDDEPLRISCSIGIAVSPHDGIGADTLLKHADTALYHAKQAGRAHFAFFTDSMGQALSSQLQLERDMAAALKKQQFLLEFQPIVDVLRGTIAGAEALIRWDHPQRGRIPPLDFIPAAERCGQIGRIGQWVLDSACRQLAEWHDRGLTGLTVAVNLSPAQLVDPTLVDQVAACLKRHRIPGDRLTAELTESMLMEDPESASRQLSRLRDLGVSIAIDDFGTGYSSLSYMKQLTVDKLKIDKEFLANLEQLEDRQIVRAIIALAHSLHLDVVAEGVEREEQLEYLTRWQCRYYQGYFFSRPVDPQRFLELVLTGPEAKGANGDGRNR